jgi:hypothetical protein
MNLNVNVDVFLSHTIVEENQFQIENSERCVCVHVCMHECLCV